MRLSCISAVVCAVWSGRGHWGGGSKRGDGRVRRTIATILNMPAILLAVLWCDATARVSHTPLLVAHLRSEIFEYVSWG